MSKNPTYLMSVRLIGCITIVLWFQCSIHAQTKNWNNAGGGLFDITGNWLEGSPPTDTETAVFGLDADYDVDWDIVTGDRESATLNVTDGNVRFRSFGGPRTYHLGAGQHQLSSASLTVGEGGSEMTVTYDGSIRMSRESSLVIGNNGRVNASSFRMTQNTAEPGPLQIMVENGGKFTLDPGQSSNIFSDGSLSVTGAGSEFVGGDIFGQTGANVNFTVAVSDGGSFTSDIFSVGLGDQWELTVEDSGSQAVTGNLSSGSTGNLAIVVRDAASLQASQLSLNNGSSLAVNGLGSTLDSGSIFMNSNGSLSFFDQSISTTGSIVLDGSSSLFVTQGASLNSGTIDIRQDSNAFLSASTLNATAINLRSGRLFVDGNTLTTNALNVNGGELSFRSGFINVTSASQTLVLDRKFTTTGDLNETDRQLNVAGQVIIDEGVSISTRGQGLNAGKILNNGSIAAIGATATLGSIVNNGHLFSSGATLGDSSQHDGYGGSGTLRVAHFSATLLDRGLAELGSLTTLGGIGSAGAGNIIAANGFALGSGGVISGFGNVTGRIAGDSGSAIYAEGGDLTIGDAGHVAGFSHYGELYTDANRINILDANQAQLGGYTQLGGASGSGYLDVQNGAILDFGDNLVGYGTIDNQNTLATAIINNGAMIGDSITNRLIVEGYVKGLGTFENVQFNGTFAPGLSPTITNGTNFFFGGTSLLEMEIGGLIRGDEHDAIVASGLLSLDGTLQVLLINGFEPLLGNSFDLFDWGSIEGAFHTFNLPTLNGGLRWDTSQLYSDGSLSVSAVPEPASGAILLAFGILISLRRRRV